MLEDLIHAGMNVARVNFSHGDHAEQGAKIANIRAAAQKTNTPIALLQDLCGPKVRIGDFTEGSITLVPGEKFTLSTVKCEGTKERVFIDYPHLHTEVKKGAVILLDDGRRKLIVEQVRGTDIITKIVVGGTIKGRRGVNAPGAFSKISAITTKDKKDLAFGLEQGFDFVALSFVRSPKDIRDLRKLIEKQGTKDAPRIIAKIETPEAVEAIDDIIAEADGIMVARGDLAVEVGPEQVPFIQKRIIRACVVAGKPVITATQMLESMVDSPVPTRAEVADVTNAILDGTDAVMLSEESALGRYPVEAVTMMSQIAYETENHRSYRDLFKHFSPREQYETVDALGRAVAETAVRLQARAIVALSESGYTGRMIARHRPMQPIIVFTPHERTARRLALSFACHPFLVPSFDDLFGVIAEAKKDLLREKIAQKGDPIILVAGIPFGKSGNTNTLMVQTV
jgi:pyruvate kinase